MCATATYGAVSKADARDLNMWGTPRAWVGPDHCAECEREDGPFGPRHYITCPLHPANRA